MDQPPESSADRRERRQLHAATKQVVFREINEKLEGLNASFSEIIPLGDFVCECADLTCIERIEMTVAEYEQLRAHPTRFAVCHGHVSPDAERVVEKRSGYTIVEKLGAGSEYAARFDPRASD
ncbi:MAG: hypothetical protein JWO17_527 [Actinomycetia bacterium]|nr:hypothetical protein [Actinomycetes bacterium]